MYEPSPKNFCDGVYFTNDGKKHRGSSLAVRLTAYCDNACDFCIAQEDMKDKRKVNVPKLIEETRKLGSKHIQILGGEPLLFLDNCLEYVKGVQEQTEYINFVTSLPRSIETQWDKFVELMNLIQSLNISIQSTDWEENNEILVAKNKFNRIALLERIVSNPDMAKKVLVHLNLVKGGIDSTSKLWNALDDLNDIGVQNVRLNELQRAPEQYVSFEEISDYEMKSPYAHGCKTFITDLYPGMNILVKRSCFMVEDSLLASEDDVVKLNDKINRPVEYAWQEESVIYEDGSPKEYWQKPRDNKVSLGLPKIRVGAKI